MNGKALIIVQNNTCKPFKYGLKHTPLFNASQSGMGSCHATYAIVTSSIADGDTPYHIGGFECVVNMCWVTS